MDDKQSLSHTKWECKYHLVWIPKYRKKELYGGVRKHLGPLFKDLASQRESQILEGHLKPDHVHILISIAPKYSVSQVVGFLKGKSAIQIARVYLGKRKNFVGHHFWARGYFFSTVGMNEETIRAYKSPGKRGSSARSNELIPRVSHHL